MPLFSLREEESFFSPRCSFVFHGTGKAEILLAGGLKISAFYVFFHNVFYDAEVFL